jgi:hypothetical protein
MSEAANLSVCSTMVPAASIFAKTQPQRLRRESWTVLHAWKPREHGTGTVSWRAQAPGFFAVGFDQANERSACDVSLPLSSQKKRNAITLSTRHRLFRPIDGHSCGVAVNERAVGEQVAVGVDFLLAPDVFTVAFLSDSESRGTLARRDAPDQDGEPVVINHGPPPG